MYLLLILIGHKLLFLLFLTLEAPEALCSQVRSHKLELRFLRQLLHLHSATQQKIQNEADQLHAPDQKGNLRPDPELRILSCLKCSLPCAAFRYHKAGQSFVST